MTWENRVRAGFEESIQTKHLALEQLVPVIVESARRMVTALRAGGKILTCGNGGSAGDAQHFASELLNRYERDRAGLAAIALSTDPSTVTSIANDYSFEEIFAKQVSALGKPEDVLLVFSTSGNSENVVRAVQAAKGKGMTVVACTGGVDAAAGGKVAGYLSQEDIHLCVPSPKTARIQETHLVIIHSLCDLIDEAYFEKEGI